MRVLLLLAALGCEGAQHPGAALENQLFDLELLGIGGATGVQDGDRLFLAREDVSIFTFRHSPGPGEVQIFATGNAALDIARTADALGRTINATAAAPCRALGSEDGMPPGKVLLWSNGCGHPFYVGPDNPASWAPPMEWRPGADLAGSACR